METKKTIIPMSAPRMGSSMLAGILMKLGVYMGERIKPTKNEDMDILFQPMEKKIETIKKRNQTQEVWGFKTPWIGNFITIIEKMLINPKYVYLERKMEDAVKSDLKRNPKANYNGSLSRNISLKGAMLEFLKNKEYLRLTYEGIVENPEENIRTLAEFIDIGSTEEQIQNAIKYVQPGDYRKA